MNYGSIKLADCANGPGMRVSLFVSGCRNHCEGCFQPETWDFNFGKKFTYDTHLDILTEVMKPFYDGVSILGGDPMEYENEWGILPLIMGVKLLRKTVWVYTGYTWEDLMGWDWKGNCNGITRQILENTDVLVDGPFIEAEKDISLLFRGSRNQRLINVPESLKTGRVVLWEGKC